MSKDFLKKYKLSKNNMTKSDLPRTYYYPIYPSDSKLYSDRGFVNIVNGSVGGTHWVCFYIKDNKSLFLISFGGATDKLLLNQLPKPVIFHIYKIQDMNSKLCGSYC